MLRNLAAVLIVAVAGLVILYEAIETTPPTSAQAPATLGGDAGERLATVSVTGTGEAIGVPDIGRVRVGVVTEGPAAGETLAQNSARMAALFETLATRGVAERDVQTTGLNINPVFSQPDRRRTDDVPEAPRIVGYRVENQVSVKVRNLDAFGAILDELVSSGANPLHGIQFDIDEPQPLLDRARAAAVRDARRKAEVLAEAGGFRIGRILEVRESGGIVLPPQPGIATFRGAEAAVPIAEGELTFTVNVAIGYEIVAP